MENKKKNKEKEADEDEEEEEERYWSRRRKLANFCKSKSVKWPLMLINSPPSLFLNKFKWTIICVKIKFNEHFV